LVVAAISPEGAAEERVSHQIFRKNPMKVKRIANAIIIGSIMRWSIVAEEIAVKIANGLCAIAIAANAKNNHLYFFSPAYFMGPPQR
jgi:hypothetical protein